jgi:DNA-binding HxlR family transcriptional regulator
MVIWRLLDRPLRYSEMAQRVPEITERVLSQVLKELENDGIVERSKQKEWQLTALGQALKPSLNSMFAWGQLAQAQNSKPRAKWQREIRAAESASEGAWHNSNGAADLPRNWV